MAYIFRLQKDGGKNTINGWKPSEIYTSTDIAKIEDPNGASAKKQITSIPSPFARMDLVKTAFRIVAQKDANGKYNLKGNTIFHKMVSDTLDVAQIFFEYDRHRNKVEIIPWDMQNDLQALCQSGDSAHKQLGGTCKLFIDRDIKMPTEESDNFKDLRRIFLLKYKGKYRKSPLDIIGATSPATLFFCSANDLSYIKDITFGQDYPFDSNYQPLYARNIEFHKYMWNLSKSISNFATLFPEVNAYLAACYQESDNKDELDVCSGDMNAYELICVGGNRENRVEVLGNELRQMPSTSVHIAQQSDFVIDSPIYKGANPPLVLPVEMLYETKTNRYIYVRDPWDKNTKVPFHDPTPWKDRTLPDDGSKYPYLTISDFLEDYMIASSEVTAENRKIYFDGNSNDIENGYLLPIKDLFFEFFTTEDLINGINGTKLIELKKGKEWVNVYLRIPVKNGRFIEYYRTYYCKNEPQIDSNAGAIVNHNFAFAMFPNIKFNNASQAFYRMGLLYQPTDTAKYDIECKYQGNNVTMTKYIRNAHDTNYPKGYAIAVEQSNFDYVRLQCNNASGIIVPKFQIEVGTKKFTFAIDFGTTNTHIAYRVNEDPIHTFDVTKDDRQIYPFAEYGFDYQFVFDADFMPQLIGNGRYKFPMRTALNEATNTNWKQPVYPMIQANLAFTYEKLMKYEYNDINTTLKWSTDNEEEVKCYIYSLMLLLRNKVLLNGGSLENTRIVWFYPISMIGRRQKLFEKVWQDAYTKYFSNNENDLEENKNELEKKIYGMTESLAPYESYKISEGLNNVVTIDIGGGSTDVVMAEAGEVKCITSFRFAADAIFGDAFGDNNSSQNGIVRQFKQTLKDVLDANADNDNEESKLVQVYQQLDNANRSADFASFLFSLKDNVEKEKANLFDFNKIMQYDSTQKMSFIFFYAAIIYHIAHIMKVKELNMPRHIAFSGNGSKVISILSADSATLEDFTKIIFEKVFESKYPKDGLTIHMVANPKEITCKGGLLYNPNQNKKENVAKIRVILDSADHTKVSPLSHFTYKAIADDKDYKDKTVKQVERFINFVFKLDDEFSFCDNFGIDAQSLSIAKKECHRDLLEYLDNGIRLYGGESTDDEDKGVEVEETLFFYPLIGMLHALADAICNNQK